MTSPPPLDEAVIRELDQNPIFRAGLAFSAGHLRVTLNRGLSADPLLVERECCLHATRSFANALADHLDHMAEYGVLEPSP